MSRPIDRRLLGLLATVGASLLLIALGTAGSAGAATIYACQKKKGGTIRIVSAKAKCNKKTETKISWNTEGPAGKNGANGTNGTNGAAGQPQTAVHFEAALAASIEAPTKTLFEIDGVTVRMECLNFIASFDFIEASAPTGSHAETGMVVTKEKGEASEIAQEPVVSVALTPTFTKIATLASNLKEPYANISHLDGSIATPTGVVVLDAYMKALRPTEPSACTASGVAFGIPT